MCDKSCKCNCKCNCTTSIIILALLVIAGAAFSFFFKTNDALELETIKAGGKENMNAVMQIYKSDTYKAQQTQVIQGVIQQLQGTWVK